VELVDAGKKNVSMCLMELSMTPPSHGDITASFVLNDDGTPSCHFESERDFLIEFSDFTDFLSVIEHQSLAEVLIIRGVSKTI
jgi:hypothetical protein